MFFRFHIEGTVDNMSQNNYPSHPRLLLHRHTVQPKEYFTSKVTEGLAPAKPSSIINNIQEENESSLTSKKIFRES